MAAACRLDEFKPLLANHLAFMAVHRGTVEVRPEAALVEGAIPPLSLWIPFAPQDVPEGCRAVRLVPWSGSGWADELVQHGFRPAEELAYMELAQPLERCGDIEVLRCRTREDARTFAAIQSAGFVRAEDPDGPWWRACFLRALQNVTCARQRFYVASVDKAAAAVALMFATAGVEGLYAVATAPPFRRRGLSRGVLARAVEDVPRSSGRRIALQAVSRSYAEAYYEKLGFRTRFRAQTWRLPPEVDA